MIYVDGLECSNFDREVFQELNAGRLGCTTVTCGFWGGAVESMDALAHWHQLVRDNADLVEIALTPADVERIAADGRTAILLGFQNSSFLDGRIGYVELFHGMGVRVAQLTYNIQNDIGGACYDPVDGGLTRFGREVVEEMNRVGMLVDLSHVGDRTSREAVEASVVPVAITHANPQALVPHKRNAADDTLKVLAERGGVIGVSGYRNISGAYAETVDTWARLVADTAEIVSIDHVGIGTDLGRKVTFEDLQWMRQGRWTRKVQYGAGSASNPGKQPPLPWLTDTSQFPGLEEALTRYGFAEREVAAVMGGNWMRVYREVFGEE